MCAGADRGAQFCIFCFRVRVSKFESRPLPLYILGVSVFLFCKVAQLAKYTRLYPTKVRIVMFTISLEGHG